MERILITGAAGFVGSHMIEFMTRAGGLEVHGIDRKQTRRDNIAHLADRFIYHEADLTDFVSTLGLIREIRPDRIFHLAAQSFVPASWRAPEETIRTNIMAQLNIFEACRELALFPKIQIAGSSEEYGLVRLGETPIKETNPLRPLSPYGVSKVAQDLLGYQYYRSYGLPIYRTRAFNHTGPRRGEEFASSQFAKQVAEVELGRRHEIEVGNLEAVRDISDVRDICVAYWLLTERGDPGEVYNVCSGHAICMADLLKALMDLSGPAGTAKVKVDPSRMRPSDVPLLLGDPCKIHRLTGWVAGIPLKKTLEDLLNHWRLKLRQ